MCFFLTVQATIFWWDILSLGCIMSSNKLESFPIRFTIKNYSVLEFQFKLFSKGKNFGVILMGVFLHLKVPSIV